LKIEYWNSRGIRTNSQRKEENPKHASMKPARYWDNMKRPDLQIMGIEER
jgi:hypothetical protein